MLSGRTVGHPAARPNRSPRAMTTPQPQRVYEQYEGTPLWCALEAALADLQASREISVGTAPRYILGYLCQELAAKWVVTGDALTRGH